MLSETYVYTPPRERENGPINHNSCRGKQSEVKDRGRIK